MENLSIKHFMVLVRTNGLTEQEFFTTIKEEAKTKEFRFSPVQVSVSENGEIQTNVTELSSIVSTISESGKDSLLALHAASVH